MRFYNYNENKKEKKVTFWRGQRTLNGGSAFACGGK